MKTFQGVERIIYEFLIGHAGELATISAKEIAAKAFTTTTSVNRVSKKLGYASYTELRYKLARDLSENQGGQQQQPQQQEQLEAFAMGLKEARVVYLYSRGASLVSGSYLSRFLSLTNIPHLVITDIHQLTLASEGVLVVISKSGMTQAVIEMAHNAKRKGLKVFSISHRDSTLAKFNHRNLSDVGAIDSISPYSRESQLHILKLVDSLGELLLRP
ncbi:MurR/RpiR family transcriptional regulator [Dongshaea marina]|uniref:MurR/RpiR family transcriptional regulator n=1 Tax=Dongshaea marina TaxID=2047966 RepID=UPI000D3E7E23|nr:MurR/RpiR family transcriptional regulator [Dongshaea marina]